MTNCCVDHFSCIQRSGSSINVVPAWIKVRTQRPQLALKKPRRRQSNRMSHELISYWFNLTLYFIFNRYSSVRKRVATDIMCFINVTNHANIVGILKLVPPLSDNCHYRIRLANSNAFAIRSQRENESTHAPQPSR